MEKKKWNCTRGSSSSALCLGLGWDPKTQRQRDSESLASRPTWNLLSSPALPQDCPEVSHHHGVALRFQRAGFESCHQHSLAVWSQSFYLMFLGLSFLFLKLQLMLPNSPVGLTKNNTCTCQSHGLRSVSPFWFHMGIRLFSHYFLKIRSFPTLIYLGIDTFRED